MKRFLLVCSLLASLVSTSVWAGSTRSFVLDSASVLEEGKLEGTIVRSEGSIARGVTTRRTDLPGVNSAKSLLVAPDGTSYIGTGNDGKIYTYAGGVAKLFAETHQVMVASLARDAQGTLYAGTLPKGKIFAISSAGKVRELASPKDVQHVWALVYDDAKHTLYAATGPNGQIFAIDANGKAEVYYDSEASHIMSLARDADGTLYAGTSDQALVLRLRGVGRADVVYDFEGNEVTALAVKQGVIVAAANFFPKPTGPTKPATPGTSSDQNSPQSSAPTPTAATPSDKPQAGKGQLYRVDRDGRAEKLFTSESGHLTTVEWGDDDLFYVGTGKEGHIHRVLADHTHALWVDVDERQVLATSLRGKKPVFVTGDGAAIYEIERGPAQHALWTSKVLDAGTVARFGQLTFRGLGKLSFQTRAGNTDKADGTWSDWSPPLTAAGPVRSPGARFLQVRASLDSPDALVYAIEVFYLPQNQPALVSDVMAEPPRQRSDKPGSRSSSANSSVYKLRWKVDNPDGDTLRYRLAYKREENASWRSLLRDSDVLTSTEYSWDTEGIPDGFYRVRVESSDELDNPTPIARKLSGESEPFLIDNHPPSVVDLRVSAGKLMGKAIDTLGPISKIEYTPDGIEWFLMFPVDALFDTREETFELPLQLLPKGELLVMVRATDARGNVGSSEITVRNSP
jgi:outer membrane protein assembly factor BamB